MLVSTKTEAEIAERFKEALDIAALEGVPHSTKREAAEAAARAVVTFLRQMTVR